MSKNNNQNSKISELEADLYMSEGGSSVHIDIMNVAGKKLTPQDILDAVTDVVLHGFNLSKPPAIDRGSH